MLNGTCTEFINSPLNILSQAVSYATLVASFCTAPIGAIRQNFTLLFSDTSVSANIVLYRSNSVHGNKNGLIYATVTFSTVSGLPSNVYVSVSNTFVAKYRGGKILPFSGTP